MSELLTPNDCELLFSAKEIGGKTAPNRFAAQPMEANDSDPGGKVSRRALDRYRRIAGGEWGITVVEAVSVTPDAVARKNQLVITPSNLEGFKRLVDAYKSIHPDGLLLFQITHPGQYDGPYVQYDASCGNSIPEVLSDSEIRALLRRFIESAGLLRKAGADGIDFKLSHGCFGRDMICPANVRDDQWGGSFENRTRFLRDALEELRSIHRKGEFIIGSRISMYDGVRGGCGTASADSLLEDLTEMKRIISLMADLGGDYLNVSAGIPGCTSEMIRPAKRSKWVILQHFRYCSEAKQAAPGMPVIGSAYSMLRDQSVTFGAENIRRGIVDFIGLGRQVFADPMFPKKVRKGEPVDFCRACLGCSKLMNSQQHDGCVVYDSYYRMIMKAMARDNHIV